MVWLRLQEIGCFVGGGLISWKTTSQIYIRIYIDFVGKTYHESKITLYLEQVQLTVSLMGKQKWLYGTSVLSRGLQFLNILISPMYLDLCHLHWAQWWCRQNKRVFIQTQCNLYILACMSVYSSQTVQLRHSLSRKEAFPHSSPDLLCVFYVGAVPPFP